jgi:hypothetical protein
MSLSDSSWILNDSLTIIDYGTSSLRTSNHPSLFSFPHSSTHAGNIDLQSTTWEQRGPVTMTRPNGGDEIPTCCLHESCRFEALTNMSRVCFPPPQP